MIDKAIHVKDTEGQDVIILTQRVNSIHRRGAELCDVIFSDGSELTIATDFQELLEILQTP